MSVSTLYNKSGFVALALYATLLLAPGAFAQTADQCGGATASQGDGGCSAVSGKDMTEFGAVECPNGACTDDGPISKCVAAGMDPPVKGRPDCGRGVTFTGLGSTNSAGKCPPSIDGTLKCQVANIAGAPKIASIMPTINNLNMCSLSLPSLSGLIPALPCGGGIPLLNQVMNLGSNISIGSIVNSASTINNIVGSGWCNEGTPLTGTTLPLPSDAVSLVLPPTLGSVSFGSGLVPPVGSAISIPQPPPIPMNINPGNGGGSVNLLTLEQGGTITGPDGLSIYSIQPGGSILPLGDGVIQLSDINNNNNSNNHGIVLDYPRYPPATPQESGNISFPYPNFTYTPLPVSFSLNKSGDITFPAGGSFLGPDNSTVYTLPPYGTLFSKGNGQLILPDGTILNYPDVVHAIGIATSAVLTGSITMLDSGTTSFSVDVAGSIMLPQGGTLTGPDGTVYTIPQNGILTSLGGGKLQLPDGGALLNFPNGGSIAIAAVSVMTGTTSPVQVDPNGSQVSPQNSAGGGC